MADRPTVLVMGVGPRRDALVHEVELAGARPEAFESVEDAVASIPELHPLLALVADDEALQSQGGPSPWEVLHTHARIEGTALVACGSARSPDLQRAFASGADDFLPFPLPRNALRRKLERLQTPARIPPRPRREARSAKTVVIGSADLMVRMRMEALLEHAGYRSVFAESARELATAFRATAHACVLDVTSLELGGPRALELVPDSLPLVVLAGPQRSVQQALKQRGITAVLDATDLGMEGAAVLVDQAIAAKTRRREAQRASFLASSEFRHAALGNAWEFGFIYNLGPSGAFVRTLVPPPDKEAVELRFALEPGTDPLTIAARVAWAQPHLGAHGVGGHPPGMGLAFEGIDGPLAERIANRVGIAPPAPDRRTKQRG